MIYSFYKWNRPCAKLLAEIFRLVFHSIPSANFRISHFKVHPSCFSVPPTKIEIEGVKSGSRLSVRENEMVELKCLVYNAKPKAHIVWFRENAEFYSGKFKFLTL